MRTMPLKLVPLFARYGHFALSATADVAKATRDDLRSGWQLESQRWPEVQRVVARQRARGRKTVGWLLLADGTGETRSAQVSRSQCVHALCTGHVRLLRGVPHTYERVVFVTLLRVLLIEASRILRKSLTEFLEELAPIRVVHVVEDAPSAIDWLRDDSNECDLAIVDIFLRPHTGLRFLRVASSLKRPLRLLVLSNSATVDIRRTCLQFGAHAVFDKSTELDQLLSFCTRLASGDTGSGSLNP